MLMEVSDSLWIIVKANLTIIFSATTSLLSVVLFSGHAMVKFLFNAVRTAKFELVEDLINVLLLHRLFSSRRFTISCNRVAIVMRQ